MIWHPNKQTNKKIEKTNLYKGTITKDGTGKLNFFKIDDSESWLN